MSPQQNPRTPPFQCFLFLSLLDGHLIVSQGLETLHEESYRYTEFEEPRAKDLNLSLLSVSISCCKVDAKLCRAIWVQEYMAVRNLLPVAHIFCFYFARYTRTLKQYGRLVAATLAGGTYDYHVNYQWLPKASCRAALIEYHHACKFPNYINLPDS